MHKITKGLKKKKKGKKSKHKEEELFKPEELEAYRREHQEEPSTASGQNEEWKKFLALTSGVDDVLKKTQGDLDRIKSTSFFQRVPPPSEVKKQEQEAQNHVDKKAAELEKKQEAEKQQAADIGIVQISESESEEDEEDDIFDTAYIDVIASGEVKLAYIPESPTEDTTGDDPFDTSIAERAILGPAVERKGKKLVPIGAAVEVLTGRVQIPTCATPRPASARRQVLKERDLLLGSFDDNANSILNAAQASAPAEVQKTLLDDDTPIPLAEEPIDLSKNLHQTVTPQTPNKTNTVKGKVIVSEFDVIGKNLTPDEDDEEFAKLAAESLTRIPVAVVVPQVKCVPLEGAEEWAAFSEERPAGPPNSAVEVLEDPFDTSFAENILPGKAELKIIENEILKQENDFDFDPRADDKFSQIINQVSIKVTDPAGQRESISSLDRVSEADLNLIKPIHRDLLGGSNTDLSNLSDKPLRPSEQIDDNYIEYCDPFDTSIVETAQLPGHTELKFIEKELLGDIKSEGPHHGDDEFDPRASETKERTLSRPDVLNITTAKTVSFDIPSPDKNLLDTGEEHWSKITKPLTPFYVRRNSIPEEFFPEEDLGDPFDTSFASDIGPGKAELKQIESELFDPATERRLSISDQDFDPRNEKKVKIAEVVQSIKEIVNTANKPVDEKEQIDLLAVDHDVAGKVLTPAVGKSTEFETLSYGDPFDTSIATNIAPGKTELKLLETELIHSADQALVDQDFDPRSFNKTAEPSFAKRNSVDLLDDFRDAAVSHQPLNPVVEVNSFDTDIDIDPFDTSIANNIVPGVNPFLFNEDDYTSPHSAASNPFLMGDDNDYPAFGGSDNPFLTQTATSNVASNNSNPFAFDPMDLEPAEAAPVMYQNNTFVDVTPSNNEEMFSTSEATAAPSQDFFSTDHNQVLLADIVEMAPQKPTDLDLKFTNTVANGAAPTRPPPPRPPPSKETQDLLMSVMGAMDATSSHLLDRIPPTRTPSPVSMRDLHSPSPTPEPTFGDLLDVGASNNKSNVDTTGDLLSLNQDNSCDINQNPPEIPEVQSKPTKPKPPRPKPPVPKPPAPVVRPAPVTVPSQPQDEMMDMFGVENAAPTHKVATNADILNLYNAPPKQEKTATDLFFDNVEPEPEVVPKATTPPPVTTQEPVTVENIPEVKTTPEPVHEPVTQDNFISPVPSQNDLQMDTSDSQSKGSVSSVTFNPFAATEDATIQQISPSKQEVFQQETPTPDNNVFLQNSVDTQPRDIFGTTVEPTQGYGFGATIENTEPTQDYGFGATIETTEPTQDYGFGATIETTEPTQNYDFGPPKTDDEFDAFAQKFESVENKNVAFDSFTASNDAWGNDFGTNQDGLSGFGAEESFDAFLALQEPPTVPQSTPNRISKNASQESDEDKDFSVFIRPKGSEEYSGGALPTIAPPPAPVQAAFTDTSPRFNPFDQNEVNQSVVTQQEPAIPYGDPELKRTDSQETPPSPLYDEDVSQPLEPFPRINFAGEGWEMQLRQPNKKKITGQRFWKKIFVKIVYQPDCVLLQLFNQQADKDPFQELPLQPCYSVSDIGAQQYDQYGKIFTIKLQYIFYKERPGVRPGQVKKAERITNKLSQFAAYAIQGDYQGVKEFGSDLKKLGLPVEHAPQLSQLMKIGSLSYEDLKQFSFCIEEALFRLQAHRDRALHYKMEEVQITLVDELYVEQDSDGHVEKQIARVRLFFLGFLTGMPDIELGVNDMRRQGKEVVGRHDIIPVVTEEWIRLEDVEFHSCIQQDEYNTTHTIKFKPPDACYIELMRFRVRPPKNRELPLQLKAAICITGNRVELRADVLVPGFASRKLGQIPCEDVMIKFPIPECWIYLFRVEKHFRYGSVKSAHRRTGKIKGIERILGTVDTLQESLIEVTSGQAKYEHQHRAIVWRCPRLPKEGQGAYTTHNMLCKLALTSYDQMPDKLAEYCYVEFTMPATQVSHTTCRSVSLQNSDSDDPPEKYVRYLARHEYRVGIEHSEGDSPNAYAVATAVKPAPKEEEKKPAPVPEEESSSDSDD